MTSLLHYYDVLTIITNIYFIYIDYQIIPIITIKHAQYRIQFPIINLEIITYICYLFINVKRGHTIHTGSKLL